MLRFGLGARLLALDPYREERPERLPSPSGLYEGRRSIWASRWGCWSMIGELGLRIDSIDVRFEASDNVLSVRMCVGSSGTMDSARLWRVLGVSLVFVEVRERVAVLLLGFVVLEVVILERDSRFFFIPK